MAPCYPRDSYTTKQDGPMANFIVTFQIKADDTYQSRYSSFKKKINELTSYKHWDETTSFYCFELDYTAQRLCSELYTGSEFNATKDIMVVIDVSNREKATKGPIQYPALLDSYLGF
ncbi:hypothetical protein APB06_03310 [Pseudomonas aeruginosa]|nr:hypothetical protein APB06_03310 [Pseudomonas aeruginosa]